MKVQLLLVSLVLCCSATSNADIIPQDFTLFATHPDALLQPTGRGQTIRDLQYFEGQLYAGYGDWASDYGPIQIRALDPMTAQWTPSLLQLSTEAISHYRRLGSNLYATNLDPQGVGVQPSGFAVGNASHQWAQVDNVMATHVFDINQTANGDLWMVGSVGDLGAVWRSTDGGVSFAIERLDTPAPGAPSFAFSRYVGAAVFDNQLIVQRVDINTVHNPESLVFDGTTWNPGPDLIPAGNGFVVRPEQFLDNLVYLSDDLSGGNLFRYDGQSAQLTLTSLVHDYQIVDGRIVVLAVGGELLVSTDLSQWSSLGFAPLEARSLELVDQRLFLGTGDANILRLNQVLNVSAVPEPSSLTALVIMLAAGLGIRFRRRTAHSLAA